MLLDETGFMLQPVCDKYIDSVREGAMVIYENDLVTPIDRRFKGFGWRACESARNSFQNEVVANSIMLGCLVGLTGAVAHKSVCRAISESVPGKSVKANLRAFEKGVDMATGARTGMTQSDCRRGTR